MAAACATTAGWIRTVGQVTPIVTRKLVLAPSAPITLQTKGLCPWDSSHVV